MYIHPRCYSNGPEHGNSHKKTLINFLRKTFFFLVSRVSGKTSTLNFGKVANVDELLLLVLVPRLHQAMNYKEITNLFWNCTNYNATKSEILGLLIWILACSGAFGFASNTGRCLDLCYGLAVETSWVAVKELKLS